MNLSQIIKRPVITEKTHQQSQTNNSHTFEVDVRANKDQIKNALEEFFGVKVVNVRTITTKGEKRRTGRRRLPAKNVTTKKAIVKLAEGQSLKILNREDK